MEYGKRIVFNSNSGKVLNYCLEEMSGNLQEGLRPETIDFIDLPYGDNTLQDALEYHVDIETKTIIIDSYMEHVPTYKELQQQLLIEQGVI